MGIFFRDNLNRLDSFGGIGGSFIILNVSHDADSLCGSRLFRSFRFFGLRGFFRLLRFFGSLSYIFFLNPCGSNFFKNRSAYLAEFSFIIFCATSSALQSIFFLPGIIGGKSYKRYTAFYAELSFCKNSSALTALYCKGRIFFRISDLCDVFKRVSAGFAEFPVFIGLTAFVAYKHSCSSSLFFVVIRSLFYEIIIRSFTLKVKGKNAVFPCF